MAFHDSISCDELIARTSADSLTIRTLIGRSASTLLENAVLLIGSIVALFVVVDEVNSTLLGVLFAVLGVQIVTTLLAILVARLARNKNQTARRRLGRLLGFSFDTFVHYSNSEFYGKENGDGL